MGYARDPGDTPEPPCFCGNHGGDWVLTTEEFCPACGDPDKPVTEPEGNEDELAYVAEHGSDDLEAGHLRDPEGDEAAHA